MPTLEQVELAEKTLDFIKKHHASWDQHNFVRWMGWLRPGVDGGDWDAMLAHPDPEKALACGTAACYAGWLAIIDHQPFESGSGTNVKISGGGWMSLSDWGCKRLDLPYWDGGDRSNHLFADENEIDDLERHVATLRDRYEAEHAAGV